MSPVVLLSSFQFLNFKMFQLFLFSRLSISLLKTFSFCMFPRAEWFKFGAHNFVHAHAGKVVHMFILQIPFDYQLRVSGHILLTWAVLSIHRSSSRLHWQVCRFLIKLLSIFRVRRCSAFLFYIYREHCYEFN